MDKPDMDEGAGVRVACVQFAPSFGQMNDNVDRTVALIREATRRGADLVVLPELCSTGYVFESRDELIDLAEPVDDSLAVTAWAGVAGELGVHVVAGFAERAGNDVFNAAVLLGPDGRIACYRKAHLSDREKDLFNPGDSAFAVHDTGVGRIALLLCYDIWFPEAVRACALRGAEIICVPTNWSDLPEPQEGPYPMAIHLLMTGAHCNGVFFACANRIGEERGLTFNGQSVLVDKTGWLIGRPLGYAEEGIKIEICDLRRAQDKHVSKRNSVLRDRRTDLYS